MDFRHIIDILGGLNTGWDQNASSAMEMGHGVFRSPIMAAVISGDSHKVKKLLKRGESCNKTDKYGRTLLYWAALHGHVDIAEELMNSGCDINMADNYCSSPLHNASFNNHQAIAEALLRARVNVNAKNNNGFTALHLAAGRGNISMAKALLTAGAKIESKSLENYTPLHIAIIKNHLAVFNILVDNGANVNALGKKNTTPLMAAMLIKFPIDGIKKLVSKSADVNAQDAQRSSSLHFAMANNGCPELIKFLLESGANPNARNIEGVTPLQLLTQNEDIDEKTRINIAEHLIRHSAEVHLLDYLNRWAVLHRAVRRNQKELVIFLLEKCNADANAGVPGSVAPLHLSTESCSVDIPLELMSSTYLSRKLDIISALIKHGANTEAKDEQDRTPLYCAAAHASVDAVRLLLSSGSFYDFKADTIRNQLPIEVAALNPDPNVKQLITIVERFFYAIRKNDIGTVHRMIEKDSFLVHCRSSHYKTSLHYPSWKGFTEMIELLLDHGADPNSANKLFTSPLHYAVKFNHPKIVDLMLARGAMYDAICPASSKTPKTTAQEAKSVASLLVLTKIEQLFSFVISGDVEVIQQLTQFHAEDKKAFMVIQGARNNNGKRLIEEALDKKHSEIAECLASLKLQT